MAGIPDSSLLAVYSGDLVDLHLCNPLTNCANFLSLSVSLFLFVSLAGAAPTV